MTTHRHPTRHVWATLGTIALAAFLSGSNLSFAQNAETGCSARSVAGCGGGVDGMWSRLGELQSGSRIIGDLIAEQRQRYCTSQTSPDPAALKPDDFCANAIGPPIDPAPSQVARAPVMPSDSGATKPDLLPPVTDPLDVASPADGACLTPPQIDAYPDPDFKRNKDVLRNPALCMTIQKFSEGDLRWTLEIIKNKRRPDGPLWAVPHDSEDEAFSTGAYGVLTYGGVMVAVDAGEQRESNGQDPNRNFGAPATAGACPRQRAPAPEFTRRFMMHAMSSKLIVALHNNMAVGGTIDLNRPAANERPFAARPRAGAPRLNASPKHIVYIAGTEPADSANVQAEAGQFTSNGVNVMYETVTPANNDCSMSNYVALTNGGYRYFNIEAPRGARRDQKEMLKVLMRYLNIAPSAPANGRATSPLPPLPSSRPAAAAPSAAPRAPAQAAKQKAAPTAPVPDSGEPPPRKKPAPGATQTVVRRPPPAPAAGQLPRDISPAAQ